jgi:SAM-dependent methyltransferase
MSHSQDHAGHHGHHGHGGHALTEQDQHVVMDDLLDLDAEVLDGYWTAALDWVRDAAAPLAPAQVVDLGAGTGTGALGLAPRFPGATVTAVDVSGAGLRRLEHKAAALGLGPQIRTVEADLDAGWPGLGLLDLTWASMSLHHLADPAGALSQVLAATRPGGLIAVAEFREPLRFLGAGLAPGFEDRAIARHGSTHAAQMPTLGSDWAPRLAEAGWQVTAERDFPIDLNPPSHPRSADYARAWFTRLSAGLGERLEPADQATLKALLDEDGLRPDGLHIRGIRTVTLARRG